MNKTATLRIKKKYYDLIKSGEKTTEYRDEKEYYTRIFREKPTLLKLHYQDTNFLIAEIKYIRLILTPDFLKTTGIPFGRRVFAIELTKIKEYWKGL